MSKKKKTDPKLILEQMKQEKLERIQAFVKGRTGEGLSVGIPERGRRPWGLAPIDEATGGMIKGSWVNIWGQEQAGKTTLTIKAMSAALARGETVFLGDTERSHGENKEWLRQMGLPMDHPQLIYCRKPTLESALNDALAAIKEGIPDLIVIDSISALSPKGEIEGKKGDERGLEKDTIGLQARQTSKFGRHAIAHGFAEKGMTIILIAQMYKDPNAMFGSGDVMKMSSALKHFTTLRLHVRRGAGTDAPMRRFVGEDDEKKVGFSSVMTIEKVKQDMAAKEGSNIVLPFVFGKGFFMPVYYFWKARSMGLVKFESKAYLVGEKTFAKRSEMDTWLYEDPEAEKYLEELVRRKPDGHVLGDDDGRENAESESGEDVPADGDEVQGDSR
jgi:RecA/RadA recombinase